MTAFKLTKKEIEQKVIGERLKKVRLDKGLSLENVEEQIKIRAKYLRALEDEDWDAFPGMAYVSGFLKSYAKFLGISPEPLLAAYKNETKVKNKKEPITAKKEVKFKKVYFTPTILLVGFLAIAFLGVLGYIIYQVLGFASAPYLLIKSPQNGDVVYQNQVTVYGKTSPFANLSLNGQSLPADKDGNFEQSVKLNDGTNNITVSAQSRFNKKTEKDFVVILKKQGE